MPNKSVMRTGIKANEAALQESQLKLFFRALQVPFGCSHKSANVSTSLTLPSVINFKIGPWLGKNPFKSILFKFKVSYTTALQIIILSI